MYPQTNHITINFSYTSHFQQILLLGSENNLKVEQVIKKVPTSAWLQLCSCIQGRFQKLHPQLSRSVSSIQIRQETNEGRGLTSRAFVPLSIRSNFVSTPKVRSPENPGPHRMPYQIRNETCQHVSIMSSICDIDPCHDIAMQLQQDSLVQWKYLGYDKYDILLGPIPTCREWSSRAW